MNELAFPLTWHYLGVPKSFGRAPTLVTLKHFDVIVFRDSTNQLRATQSRCAHMRASLVTAKLVDDHLVCPMHQWRYDRSGQCTAIPGVKPSSIPTFACLRTYTVVEFAGHAFVHADPAHVAPLPFVSEARDSVATAWTIQGQNHWSLPAANAFDLAHFEFVHHRRVTRTPKLLSDGASVLRLVVDYEIFGTRLADRWMTKCFGAHATLDFSVYRGTFIFAHTQIGRFHNRMLIVVTATETGFAAKLLVLHDKSSSPLQWLRRRIVGYFSYRFFAQECRELAGIEVDPRRLGPHDGLVQKYFRWLSGQSSQEKPLSGGAAPTNLWVKPPSTSPEMTSQM